MVLKSKQAQKLYLEDIERVRNLLAHPNEDAERYEVKIDWGSKTIISGLLSILEEYILEEAEGKE